MKQKNDLKQDISDVHFSLFVMYNSVYKECWRYENDYGWGKKNARHKIGKTQEQLADETDYSLRQISRFENDKYLKRYDKFLQLIVALELYEPVKEEKVDM